MKDIVKALRKAGFRPTPVKIRMRGRKDIERFLAIIKRAQESARNSTQRYKVKTA